MVRGARRGAAALMVMALGVAACGGDDDGGEGAADDVGTEAAEEPEATGDEPADEDTGGAEDEPADDEATEPPADDEPADDGDGDGGSGNIGSIDDIPERCRDLMEDFLQEIEPIVEPIDWENASLTDFEAVAADFEGIAADFEADSANEACDDLDIDDEEGFELILEFAADVAPGTVPFFEFINSMSSGVVPSDGGDDGAAAPSEGSFENCDDAIAAIEEWIATYDSMTEMPVSELSKFASMGTVMMTCTPEQLEFFDSQEVTDFLGG